MAKFVCPKCKDEISNGKSSVLRKAKKHMSEEHDREVSDEYVENRMD